MSALIALLVVGPVVAGLGALACRRFPAAQAVLTVGTLGAMAVGSVVLLIAVDRDGTVRVRVGDWAPELGIELVADLFASLVLVAALATVFVVELYRRSRSSPSARTDPATEPYTGPLFLFLAAGSSLAILTGDLFTLFVAFEVMLVTSYVLLTHYGRSDQLRAGTTYVVINLVASALFLVGVAFVYGATGTVNLALLAERVPELADEVRLGIGLWFLVVFGTKAAVFPLFGWLPDTYPTAPTAVAAVLAGLSTKIGAYALIRFHTTTAMDDLGWLILTVAGVTMLVGVLGALAQDNVKGILSWHIISQIGYLLMGLGLFTVAGVAGAVLFLIHQIPVKTVMFLVGGLIEEASGSGRLRRSGGLASSRPWIAALFALAALSLAGLPPLSGFVAKLALVDAGVDAVSVPIVIVALAASMLTLLSMTKIWLGAFWGEPPAEATDEPAAPRRPTVAAAGLGVALTLAVALFAGPLWEMSERAAVDLLALAPAEAGS